MFEGLTVVYRSNVDLFFYVVGRAEENEVCNISYLEMEIIYKTILETLR